MLALGVLLGCAACSSSPAPVHVQTPTPTHSGEPAVAHRAVHTATTTPEGLSLIVGGCIVDGCGTATASVVAVSAAGTARARPDLLTARDAHTAVLLRDGSVFVAGGFSAEGQPPLASAETIAPDAGGWQATGAMRIGRGGHAAALLGDGRVVVAGGWIASHSYTETTEIFDPRTRRFGPGPRLPHAVDGLAAASLADGSVLVSGGQVRPGVATDATMIINPDGSTTRVGSLAHARFKHGMVALPGGGVLVIGGTDDDRRLLTSTEVFDPRTRTFRPGPSLANGRYKLAGGAAALPDGRVLVAGGGPGAELIDLRAGTSKPVRAASIGTVRGSFSTVSVIRDRVLILGGYDEAIRLTDTEALIRLSQL